IRMLHHSLTHPNYHVLHTYASSLCICVATLLFHPFNPFAIHQPRICVPSYAYAWDTHTDTPHFISPNQTTVSQNTAYPHAYAYNPTHMRGTLTLLHHLKLTAPSAYAYNPTHMRGTPTLHFTFPAQTPPSPTHMRTSQPKHPHHPRICVQLYAYAWNPRLHSTPSGPHRACPCIDHLYA
ncbi:hypothetical protein PIB30_109974, partial [Stylosanthes scabra]|nr:hypothetical protein [Stylosanthes scabra]